MTGPIVRIFLRYGVGALLTYQVGDMLASDADVVAIASAGVTALLGALTEWWYARAKKSGGPT